METIFTVVIVYAIIVTVLYLNDKLESNKGLTKIIDDIKSDLHESATNIGDLVMKSKEIIFDSQFTDAIKEFILIVEEKNLIAKSNGDVFLKGNEKKLEVFKRLTDWISNLTGSSDQAVAFIDDNKAKVEKVINDFIAFSNKMEGKQTLSEAEKLIEDKLKTQL